MTAKSKSTVKSILAKELERLNNFITWCESQTGEELKAKQVEAIYERIQIQAAMLELL